jgi:hypothetical protein
LEVVAQAKYQQRTVLSSAKEDVDAQVKAYREVKYYRLLQVLRRMQKVSSLRSGARGFKARKELASFEIKVNEACDR